MLEKKERIKNLKFHVKTNNYFRTLATILSLCAQKFEGQKFTFDKDKLLNKLVNDLLYLQKNYTITKKRK